jgi:hypothetical protein
MSRLSDQTVELMGAYIEGELDGEAAASFEAAMEADPALFAEVESMRETVRKLASLQRPKAPEGFSADLAARLRTRSVVERRGGMGLEERWLQLLMVAAVAMLAWLLWPHGGSVTPSAGSLEGSGSGSGVDEIVVPALPAGEVEIEPAQPSRVSGGPVLPMKVLENRYEVVTQLDAKALRSELRKVVGDRQVKEVEGGFEVTLDAGESDAERARLLNLGRYSVERVTLPAGQRPPLLLRSRPATAEP